VAQEIGWDGTSSKDNDAARRNALDAIFERLEFIKEIHPDAEQYSHHSLHFKEVNCLEWKITVCVL